MRTILTIMIFNFCSWLVNAQSWSSIHKNDSYKRSPYQQFIIDQYTNDIWINSEDQVSVIEAEGDVIVFDNNELGPLWIGCNLTLAFTPDGMYFAGENIGLNSFFSYNKQLVYNNSFFGDRYRPISANHDTIYMPFMPPNLDYNYGFKKYTPLSTSNTNHFFTRIVAKNNQLYGIYVSNYGLYKILGENNGETIDISNDPENINNNYHSLRFQRYTDTLFVSGPNGINLVYDYNYFDTITPNNTSGMLSPNVLEIEFDHEDKLWAIFGDVNDDPIGIAKLEGTNWIDYAANCPVDFNNFLGMEIDTLGNVWLADNNALHTLLGPNSPRWLSLEENNLSLKVYPNPAQDHIQIDVDQFAFATLHDLNGREIGKYTEVSVNTENLQAGVYLLRVHTLDGKVATQKVIKN